MKKQLVALLCVLSGIVVGQTDDSIRQRIASFSIAANLPAITSCQVTRFNSPATGKPRILASTNIGDFVIEAGSGRVRNYSNPALALEGGGSSLLSVAVHEQRASQLVGNLSPLSQVVYGRSKSLTGRAPKVSVLYFEKVHGLSNKGVGNHVEFVFNARTGKLVEYQAVTNFTYEPPTINISADQAKTKAKILVQQHLSGAESTPISVTKQYVPAADGFGTSGYQLRLQTKKLPYGYAVRFRDCVVFIRASDGVSLGGIRTR